MPQVPRPRRRGPRQREVQEREGLFVKSMGEKTMTDTKMTKPDALERLREIAKAEVWKEPSITIIACAEVVENRLMKERGVRVTKVLRQLSLDFRSVVEGEP